MSIVNTLPLENNRQIKINFDGGDLSSDELTNDPVFRCHKLCDPAEGEWHSPRKSIPSCG